MDLFALVESIVIIALCGLIGFLFLREKKSQSQALIAVASTISTVQKISISSPKTSPICRSVFGTFTIKSAPLSTIKESTNGEVSPPITVPVLPPLSLHPLERFVIWEYSL